MILLLIFHHVGEAEEARLPPVSRQATWGQFSEGRSKSRTSGWLKGSASSMSMIDFLLCAADRPRPGQAR